MRWSNDARTTTTVTETNPLGYLTTYTFVNGN